MDFFIKLEFLLVVNKFKLSLGICNINIFDYIHIASFFDVLLLLVF